MNTTHTAPTVISLGGSLFVPDQIDTDFIKTFKEIIDARIAVGEQFVIIVGGGSLARRYQQAGRELGVTTVEGSDWIGIYTTRLNAEFMRIVFGDTAYEQVITDPNDIEPTDKPVIFGAGWEPGWSTDYDAVMVARKVGAKRVINLSNIEYVYSADPKQDASAQPLKTLSWGEYRSIIPSEWSPGLNTPFDPIASKEAEADELEVVIMKGTKFDDLRACLAGEDFDGSIIA